MTKLEERQQAILADLDLLPYWNEKFDYIIDLGNNLPNMSESLKDSNTIISGCVSRTYYLAGIRDGKVYVEGCSNALIPKGLIALCKNIFDGLTIYELHESPVNFHISSGLVEKMTVTRADSLFTMINRTLSLV